MALWEYRIDDGSLSKDGELVGFGYSGAPGYTNRSSEVDKKSKGPIPPGEWFFDRAPWSRKGPQVMSLIRGPQTETFGRSAFMIHGDNKRRNRSASNGCIVFDRHIRDQLAADAPGRLVVLPGGFVQS